MPKKYEVVEQSGFGNVTRSLREKKELLRVAEEEAIRGGSFSWVQRLKSDILKLLVKEE